MSFVTVDTLFEVRIAEFARMKFEAEGIPVLMNSMGQAQLFGAPTLGGIRVEVPAEFAERAVAILKEVKHDLGADGNDT
jgi:putative signal transducing protein